MVDSALTDLEAAVLGVVWRDGPCTPYAVRQEFRRSPAPRWSGSAGAIYPLVQRLQVRGLLRSTAGATGKRRQRDFRTTRSGLAALRKWLRAAPSAADAGVIYDPLRTRLLFFEALPPEDARTFIAQALTTLRDTFAGIQNDCHTRKMEQDMFAHAAARSALLLTRARIKWLEEVQELLQKKPVG